MPDVNNVPLWLAVFVVSFIFVLVLSGTLLIYLPLTTLGFSVGVLAGNLFDYVRH